VRRCAREIRSTTFTLIWQRRFTLFYMRKFVICCAQCRPKGGWEQLRFRGEFSTAGASTMHSLQNFPALDSWSPLLQETRLARLADLSFCVPMAVKSG